MMQTYIKKLEFYKLSLMQVNYLSLKLLIVFFFVKQIIIGGPVQDSLLFVLCFEIFKE